MLNRTQAAEIRELVATGKSRREVAKIFGVGKTTVCDVVAGRTFKSCEVDPTDKRVLELEAEVVHLTEERNREKLKVKAGAKIAGLFTAITGEMDQRIKPFSVLPRLYRPKKKKIIEDCVMHLSDGHHDAVVKPEAVGGLEEYNFPISCARAERYVDTVIDWTQKTLASTFSFPTLWVLAYGDHTSGEIHKASERSYYRNQFRNCLAIGQLHALMFRDLAPYFGQINVLYLAGNHGRRSIKKDYNGALENWDYLVAEIARLHCRNLNNVSFLIPDSWSANIEINGIGFSISHGDDCRSNLGIPFYGLVRKQKGLIALGAAAGGVRPRYFCMGHHHCSAALADVDGELLLNGAWLATDAFAYNALAGYREPCQLLHGVNAKYGVSWRLPVKLKFPSELKGPTRYLIDGGREIGPV